MSTIIRKIKEDEIGEVKRLIDDEVGVRLEIGEAELYKHRDTYWVALFHNEIIGVIGIEPQGESLCGYNKDDYDCIKVIAIKLGYWNIGIGHKLLHYALTNFKTKKKGILAEAWDLEVGGVPRVGKILKDLGFESVMLVDGHYRKSTADKCKTYQLTNRHCDRCSLSLYIKPVENKRQGNKLDYRG